MTKQDLVGKIGDDLTALDRMLASPETNKDEARWQQLFAQRKHLDDQQRDLVKQTIAMDDTEFAVNTALIDKASARLQNLLHEMEQIDSVFRIIGQISASLDKILTAV